MSGFPLRPYQREAVDAVQDAVARGVRRPLVSLPTGTGKTVMFANLIAQRGGTALVIAHRDELLTQAADKLLGVAPDLALSVGYVAARRDDPGAPIVMASVQTLARRQRLARLPRMFDTVVIDEAHHATAAGYRRVLEHLEDCPLILGVTATPERADGQRLADVWDEVVYHRGTVQMIRDGYLADIRGIRVGLALDLGDVGVTAGDYRAEELGNALAHAHAPEHVLSAIREHAADRTCIVFVPTVALAHTMADTFRAAGLSAAALDGATSPEERAGILADLGAGRLRVVVNVGVLTEGVDVPAVDAIVMATPTRSRIRYVQSIGRGLRLHPGKTDCLVLDLVGATEDHDLQSFPRLFGLQDYPDADEAVTAALGREHDARERAAAEPEPVAAGQLHARDVEIVRDANAERLHWIEHAGRWLLTLTHGQVLALDPRDGRWSVVVLDQDRYLEIAHGLDLGYAQGVAEDYVRYVGATWITDPSATWRTKPASTSQRRLALGLALAVPPEATRGEVSDAIVRAQAVQRLQRLGSAAPTSPAAARR